MAGKSIKGIFYDGQNSGRHAGELILDDNLKIHIHGVAFTPCHLNQIVVPSRVGNTSRLIRLPDGCLFESNDNDAIDSLLLPTKSRATLFIPHYWESKLAVVLVTLLVFAAVIYGAVSLGIPAASELIAKNLPPYVAPTLAEGVLDQLDDFYLEPTHLDKVQQEHYRELFRQHAPKLDGITMQLNFRSSKLIGANAFALPDGNIILTDALIELAESDQEVAAVLLHEIGHVAKHHSIRQVLESAGTSALFIWLTEDIEGIANLILSVPVLLIQRGYSRDHEEEADSYALAGLLAADIDPIYFTRIMDKISRAPTKPEDSKSEQKQEKSASIWRYLSTHPSSQDRIERFQMASDAWHREQSEHITH